MKKFKYRLQPLLKVKSEVEKKRQKELAEVHRKVMEQEKKLTVLQAESVEAQELQRRKLSDKITVAELLVYTRYMMKLKRQKISDIELLRVMNLEFEKKRKLLLAATVERKKFEKIKENLYLKYLSENSKREAKQTDESARISHRNKKSE
jgi:flagellar FliJ protein